MPAEANKPIQVLRERRGPVPDELRQRVREHNRIQRAIADTLAEGAKTPPEVAAAIEVATDQVFWHLVAMRKYGQVAEGEQDGDYFQYVLAEKDEK
jgi:predicted transcriptional regulator